MSATRPSPYFCTSNPSPAGPVCRGGGMERGSWGGLGRHQVRRRGGGCVAVQAVCQAPARLPAFTSTLTPALPQQQRPAALAASCLAASPWRCPPAAACAAWPAWPSAAPSGTLWPCSSGFDPSVGHTAGCSGLRGGFGTSRTVPAAGSERPSRLPARRWVAINAAPLLHLAQHPPRTRSP